MLVLAATVNRQACLAIQTMHALVVDLESFALDQDAQAAIAEPPAFASQFDQPGLQPVGAPLGSKVQHAAQQTQQLAEASFREGCRHYRFALGLWAWNFPRATS
jgi:hypothetical protein